MKTYKYRHGFRAKPGIDAETCFNELERIRVKNSGNLTAPAVVQEAKDKAHTLHPYFEWRDKIAGNFWREQQARNLIGSIEVTVDNHQPVRGYQIIDRVQVQSNSPAVEVVKAYANTEQALADPEMRKQILKRCMSEVESLQRRYSALTELADAFDQLALAIKEVA